MTKGSTPNLRMDRAEAVARYGPAPVDDFLRYPGKVPETSFIYDDGEFVLLRDSSAPFETIGEWLDKRDHIGLGQRQAVLCIGSNANPAQIVGKFANCPKETVIPFVAATISGAIPVYSGHISTYGAIPATIESSRSGSTSLFVALYSASQLQRVFGTEHGNYDLAVLPGVETRLRHGCRLPDTVAFVSRRGALTLDGESPLGLADYCQEQLLEIVLARLAGVNTTPGIEEYLLSPTNYLSIINGALLTEGLTIPHQLDYDVIDVSTE